MNNYFIKKYLEEITMLMPPNGPKPIAPERKFKTKSYTKKMLDATLGNKVRASGRYINGRWESYKNYQAIPLRLFIEKLTDLSNAFGNDLATTVISQGGAFNSISITQRIFTESEDAYMERYSKFERELDLHTRWETMPKAERKQIIDEIKKQNKLVALQKKKDALKLELNEIVQEMERI